MQTDHIKQAVRVFFNRYLKHHELGDDEAIFTSKMVNSLFAMELVLFLEKEFMLKVENEDLDLKNFNTLNAISSFVLRKIEGAKSGL